jgi:hypothetical protein
VLPSSSFTIPAGRELTPACPAVDISSSQIEGSRLQGLTKLSGGNWGHDDDWPSALGFRASAWTEVDKLLVLSVVRGLSASRMSLELLSELVVVNSSFTSTTRADEEDLTSLTSMVGGDRELACC